MKKKWEPKDQSDRVCSLHFINGMPTLENPDPVLNLGYKITETKEGRTLKICQPKKKKRKREHLAEKIDREHSPDNILPGVSDDGLQGLKQGSDLSNKEIEHFEGREQAKNKKCTFFPRSSIEYHYT